jgi:hypothetical protein
MNLKVATRLSFPKMEQDRGVQKVQASTDEMDVAKARERAEEQTRRQMIGARLQAEKDRQEILQKAQERARQAAEEAQRQMEERQSKFEGRLQFTYASFSRWSLSPTLVALTTGACSVVDLCNGILVKDGFLPLVHLFVENGVDDQQSVFLLGSSTNSGASLESS